jgi:hypothetical protein
MQIVEQHDSPDGLLKFVVEREDDGDICLGFQGVGWHTHADILASSSGLSEDAAVRQFVDRLLSGRTIVAVMRIDGQIRDVWITDDPARDAKYKGSNETLEFRYWNGAVAG